MSSNINSSTIAKRNKSKKKKKTTTTTTKTKVTDKDTNSTNDGATATNKSMIPEYGPHVPEDKDQYIVQTPFGIGLIIRTSYRRYNNNTSNSNDHSHNNNNNNNNNHAEKMMETICMYEIQLTDWSNDLIPPVTSTDSSPPPKQQQQQQQQQLTDRSTDVVVKDTTTRLRRPMMLYTPIQYPTISPTIGCDIICPFGRGRVIEIRSTFSKRDSNSIHSNDNCINKNRNSQEEEEGEEGEASDTTTTTTPLTGVVVQLSSWRLAQRNKVICYLSLPCNGHSNQRPNYYDSIHSQDTVRVVRHKKVYEMSVEEKIEYANICKEHGTNYFTKKQYTMALHYYHKAVDAVKFIQHKTDTTNQVRADLLIVLITCCNNCATCAIQLHDYDKAMTYTQQQALPLLDALYNKYIEQSPTSPSKILDELHQQQYTNIKLFGEYRVKAYNILTRCYIEKDEYIQAIETIKKARMIIASYITVDQHLPSDKSNSTKNNTNNNGTNNSSTTLENNSKNDSNNNTSISEQSSIKQLQKNDRDFIKLYNQIKERKQKTLKIEKLRAQAMFASAAISGSTESTEKLATMDGTVASTATIMTTNGHNNETISSRTPTPITTNVCSPMTSTKSNPNNNNDDDISFIPMNGTTVSTSNDDSHDSHDDDEKKHDPIFATSQTARYRNDGNLKSFKAIIETYDNNNENCGLIDIDTNNDHGNDNDDDDNNDDDLPWHSDPYFLGGLGVMIGVLGTALLLSQLNVVSKR